jgi:hypothetical protein
MIKNNFEINTGETRVFGGYDDIGLIIADKTHMTIAFKFQAPPIRMTLVEGEHILEGYLSFKDGVDLSKVPYKKKVAPVFKK